MERAETTNTTGNLYQVSLVKTLCYIPVRMAGAWSLGEVRGAGGGGCPGQSPPEGEAGFQEPPAGRRRAAPGGPTPARWGVTLVHGGVKEGPGVFSVRQPGEDRKAFSVACV